MKFHSLMVYRLKWPLIIMVNVIYSWNGLKWLLLWCSDVDNIVCNWNVIFNLHFLTSVIFNYKWFKLYWKTSWKPITNVSFFSNVHASTWWSIYLGCNVAHLIQFDYETQKNLLFFVYFLPWKKPNIYYL